MAVPFAATARSLFRGDFSQYNQFPQDQLPGCVRRRCAANVGVSHRDRATDSRWRRPRGTKRSRRFCHSSRCPRECSRGLAQPWPGSNAGATAPTERWPGPANFFWISLAKRPRVRMAPSRRRGVARRAGVDGTSDWIVAGSTCESPMPYAIRVHQWPNSRSLPSIAGGVQLVRPTVQGERGRSSGRSGGIRSAGHPHHLCRLSRRRSPEHRRNRSVNL